MSEPSYDLYDKEDIAECCAAACHLLEARNAYIAAWLSWRRCPLSWADCPSDEGEFVAKFLQEAEKAADVQTQG